MMSVIMLNEIFVECRNEVRYTECRYVKCPYAECHYAECRGDRCYARK
jgi:hypothetical protein